MDKRQFRKVVSETVSDVIAKNADVIEKELFSTVNSTDDTQTVLAKMIISSIKLSAQFSVQTAMELLQSIGVVNASEVKIVPKFTVIDEGDSVKSHD